MLSEYSIPKPENLLFLRREILQAKIQPLDESKNLNCYFNVRGAINMYGGSVVDVWEVAEVSMLFLHFRPHVLWKKKTGEIIDVTPSEFGLMTTSYFMANIPHNLPMPAAYLYPLTSHPSLCIKCRLQNIAYKMIAEKLHPERHITININQLIAQSTQKLKDEKIYSKENLDLIIRLFFHDTKVLK
jgi:hypothetical protein